MEEAWQLCASVFASAFSLQCKWKTDKDRPLERRFGRQAPIALLKRGPALIKLIL